MTQRGKARETSGYYPRSPQHSARDKLVFYANVSGFPGQRLHLGTLALLCHGEPSETHFGEKQRGIMCISPNPEAEIISTESVAVHKARIIV